MSNNEDPHVTKGGPNDCAECGNQLSTIEEKQNPEAIFCLSCLLSFQGEE